MKECPVCKSKVDEMFECPICWTTLTYEPECYGKGERYAFNKYYLRYLWRQCWFSLVSLGIVLIATFFTDPGLYHLCILAWVASVGSVLMGAFQRNWLKSLHCKHTGEYARIRLVGTKYGAAGLAILAAIMMVATSSVM